MKTGYTKEHKSLGTQVTLTELSVKGVWHETKNDNTKQNVKKCVLCRVYDIGLFLGCHFGYFSGEHYCDMICQLLCSLL